MNKLNKIGVSALCGSLAAISAAKAGDLSVTGGVDMSWISYEKQDTGNPIGMGSNLTFSGSGELDNGWSVALSVANVNANAYTNVTVGVPGLGDFRISQGVSGSGIDRMDDMTPTVWEESYGAGLGTGIDTVSGASGGAGVEWTVDGGMTPDGLTARLVYSPKVGGSGSSDKAGSGSSTSVKGSGWDLTLEATDALTGIEGLTVYGGVSQVEMDQTAATWSDDVDERTIGAKYAMGGFTIGYQWSQEDNGKATGATKYSNDGYGITFQVNDDLSIGYNHYESEQSNTTNVTAEATSYQIAYSMGGASIRLAEIQADNIQYSTAAIDDRDATVLSVSLAF